MSSTVFSLHRRSFLSLPTIPGISTSNVKVTQLVDETPRNLFKLASNVQDYHKFLPFCQHSSISELKKTRNSGQVAHEITTFIGKLSVGFPGLPGVEAAGNSTISYTSNVTLFDQMYGNVDIFRVLAVNADQVVLTELNTCWTIIPCQHQHDLGSQLSSISKLSVGDLDRLLKRWPIPKDETQKSFVRLDIAYKFKDVRVQLMAPLIIDKIADQMVSAFKIRAQESRVSN